jgi:hypothetical protein
MKCPNPTIKERVVNGSIHKYRNPCGKCEVCRRQKQQQWKLRLLLESIEHEHNTFVTWTYNDIHVKDEVSKDEVKRLIKRLRKLWYAKTGKHIRHYTVAEYGTRGGRCHYHSIIFGIPFTEQQIFENAWRKNIGSRRKPVYASLGFIHARELTAARIGYCVKYSTKFLENTGNEHGGRAPEFALMSRGTKRLGTKGIGLNGISKIVDSIQRSQRVHKEHQARTLGEYFRTYVNSIRIGNSRMGIQPYLRHKIEDYIDKIDNGDLYEKIRFYEKCGMETDSLWKEWETRDRARGLRKARNAERDIPVTHEACICENVDQQNALTVARRKQREAKRKIKL